MNRSRILTTRTNLIPREYAVLKGFRRFAQTNAAPIANPTPIAKPATPRRLRPAYLWYGLVFGLGTSMGFAASNFGAPTKLPVPGSREDELNMKALTKEIEDLEVVKYMRSQSQPLHPEPPSSESPALEQSADSTQPELKKWVELDVKAHIAESEDKSSSDTRTVTFQSMAGYRGLGVQRAFWNAETKELVAAVWIGATLSGWPSIAHGGAIAMIFEDCMARMIAGPGVSLDTVAPPTSMGITYAAPTYNSSFYIVRASFSKPKSPQTEPPPDPAPAPAKSWLPSWKDFTKKEQPAEGSKTVEIIGTLESVKGDLCVRAKGTFPVGSTFI